MVLSDAINVRSIDDLKSLFGLVPVMIDNIVIDVLSNIEIVHEFYITDKPIEAGFLTDSKIHRPIEIRMNCIFTNSIENMSGSSAIKSLIGGSFSLDSWKQKRDALDELREKNKVIDIITPNKKYNSFMIENLTVSQNDSKDAHFFTIELREVCIKSTQVSDISSDEIPKELEKERDKETEKKVSKKKNKGIKPASPISESAAKQIDKPAGGHR